MLGIGALNYPLAKLVGQRAASLSATTRAGSGTSATTSTTRSSACSTSSAVLMFLFTAGLLAMGIRTELLTPTSHVIGPGTYIAIVSEHGTMMMMMATSVVVGPLGNWLVPLMIGSRRMAFPRVEAFSFWIFMAGYFVILAPSPRGVPDRMDRLRAAADAGDRRAWTPTWSGSRSSASA